MFICNHHAKMVVCYRIHGKGGEQNIEFLFARVQI
jgi:hypothetical protein